MLPRFTPLALIHGPRDHRRFRHQRTSAPRRPWDRHRARFQLDALEDRCLLSGVSSITEFPLSGSAAANEGITTGPDGNLWFTDRSSNAIGMINPTTHAISLFSLPTANAWPFGITTGPDGNLWFTEDFGNKIGEINPTTHAITEYPTLSIGWPRGITTGPDGNLWFTSFRGAIGEINPTTHVITEYPTSTKDPIWDIESIAAGSDGNLWFTSAEASYVGQFNPTTDAFSFFATPSGSSANGITAGPDGNLWFTGSGVDQIGAINPTTDAISVFALPNANAGGWNITAGPDGNLWVTDTRTNSLATINPSTDATAEYPIPYVGAYPLAITAGPSGNLWFTDDGTNAIGVATLTTSQLVVTQQPPTSVTAGSGFGLTVQAEDSSGNPITSFDGTVTVALGNNPGGATLGGTLTVTASNGVATFSGLTITRAASGYTLYTSAAGLGEGVTSAITVTPAAAAQLVIAQQPPSTVKVSGAFGLQASIEDLYGNVVVTASSAVTVAFANNPTGAILGGTLSTTASQGVATFSGLTINKTGSGYTLRVTSSGLSSAITGAITVTKTGKSSAIVAQSGINVPDSLLAPLVLDSPDLWEIPGLKKRTRSA